MNMVRDKCTETGEVELTELYNLAIQRGISENEVDRVVSKMSINGIIYEVGTDKYRFA